jgi:hypothetical protein
MQHEEMLAVDRRRGLQMEVLRDEVDKYRKERIVREGEDEARAWVRIKFPTGYSDKDVMSMPVGRRPTALRMLQEQQDLLQEMTSEGSRQIQPPRYTEAVAGQEGLDTKGARREITFREEVSPIPNVGNPHVIAGSEPEAHSTPNNDRGERVEGLTTVLFTLQQQQQQQMQMQVHLQQQMQQQRQQLQLETFKWNK